MSAKKIMLKTIGLTTFPKNRLNANHVVLSGANAAGIQIVTSTKITATNKETIANPEEFLCKKKANPITNIVANNQPNFLLEGMWTELDGLECM